MKDILKNIMRNFRKNFKHFSNPNLKAKFTKIYELPEFSEFIKTTCTLNMQSSHAGHSLMNFTMRFCLFLFLSAFIFINSSESAYLVNIFNDLNNEDKVIRVHNVFLQATSKKEEHNFDETYSQFDSYGQNGQNMRVQKIYLGWYSIPLSKTSLTTVRDIDDITSVSYNVDQMRKFKKNDKSKIYCLFETRIKIKQDENVFSDNVYNYIIEMDKWSIALYPELKSGNYKFVPTKELEEKMYRNEILRSIRETKNMKRMSLEKSDNVHGNKVYTLNVVNGTALGKEEEVSRSYNNPDNLCFIFQKRVVDFFGERIVIVNLVYVKVETVTEKIMSIRSSDMCWSISWIAGIGALISWFGYVISQITGEPTIRNIFSAFNVFSQSQSNLAEVNKEILAISASLNGLERAQFDTNSALTSLTYATLHGNPDNDLCQGVVDLNTQLNGVILSLCVDVLGEAINALSASVMASCKCFLSN